MDRIEEWRMERGGRVVIVDPSFASDVGHHRDVNTQLLNALGKEGWQAECWADAAVKASECRGVFRGCGYVDPRHWADLGGMVHLARQLEAQLLDLLARDSVAGAEPVGGWVVHTVLPYQLLGLARAWRHYPASTMVVSLMFPPGETLEGKGGAASAATNCQVALNALAKVVEQGGHRLQLVLPSQQSQEVYGPLLAAAGLECAGVHPSVVGAGLPVESLTMTELDEKGPGPRILLHWGDLKPGKGRQEALEVVAALLEREAVPATLQGASWLFHLHSQEPLPEAEHALLSSARERINGFHWLDERVEEGRMRTLLASCGGALLAYDPVIYRERSSGLLWSYAAARFMSGRPGALVGHAGSWLEREALDLGLCWHSSRNERWIDCIAEAVDINSVENNYTEYGEWILGSTFGGHASGLLMKT
ncbi:hypothetical protein [Cyanobium gracile]|uniref:CHAT domain-containing protein n=1 Tax=Cyanobium gracile UHCC 0281 TaxID=3110309 RepID=A0ABU5SZ24_9CYAN|nr:hypothetical protein [Cyanobium gracile]MEA5443277.1 hypothetical protein [Cyanobium gracile UHCC 0281]